MSLTKKDKKDIAEIVGVTIVQYHDLNVKPEFDKIHDVLAKHSEALANLDAKMESSLSDVSRKLMDLSMDTPSRSEFNKHDKRISQLEQTVFQ